MIRILDEIMEMNVSVSMAIYFDHLQLGSLLAVMLIMFFEICI